jgi:hypothetical protein
MGDSVSEPIEGAGEGGFPFRLHVGGICPRGGGHVWTYDPGGDLEAAMTCGGKSWPMTIEVEDAEELSELPDWVKECEHA